MVLRLIIPFGFLAIDFYHLVGLFAASLHVFRRQVGQGEHKGADFFFQLGLALVHRLHAVRHFFQLRHQRGGVFAALFHGRNFLVQPVAFRLQGFVFAQKGAALRVPRGEIGQIQRVATLGQAFNDNIRLVAQEIHVQHFLSLQKNCAPAMQGRLLAVPPLRAKARALSPRCGGIGPRPGSLLVNGSGMESSAAFCWLAPTASSLPKGLAKPISFIALSFIIAIFAPIARENGRFYIACA